MAVAQRMYARALFEAARDQGKLDVVREELGDFAAAVADVPELRNVLDNPELDPTAKSAVLEDIARRRRRARAQLPPARRREGPRARDRGDLPRARRARRGGAEAPDVELTTAYELSDEEADSILKKIEAASGRRVEATRKVDPELIGGVVLQAGSLRVDASVRGRLNRLRHELTDEELRT